jgi:rhodanese-related sulfurtransferase
MTTIDQVRPSELDGWLKAQDAKPVVLDVREDWELEAASVQPQGFALLTIPMGDVPARLNELDTDAAIAVLCHRGSRSQRVALFLAEQGFTKLANVAGGIDAWSAERDPAVPRY